MEPPGPASGRPDDKLRVIRGQPRPDYAALVDDVWSDFAALLQSTLAPWIDQTVGAFPTPAGCLTWAPFMNQIATLPLVSRQRISLLPSPSKSRVSASLLLAGRSAAWMVWA